MKYLGLITLAKENSLMIVSIIHFISWQIAVTLRFVEVTASKFRWIRIQNNLKKPNFDYKLDQLDYVIFLFWNKFFDLKFDL